MYGKGDFSITLSAYMANVIVQGRKSTARIAISDKYIINDEPGRYKSFGVNEDGGAAFEDLRPEITPWISPVPCPFRQWDILWVQEDFLETRGGIEYKANYPPRANVKWTLASEMTE